MVSPLPVHNTFDHLRSSDGEHVGYINLTEDGKFVPFDLLHRQRSEPMELEDAENLLDDLGLRMFTEDWWLELDGQQVKVLIREIRRESISVARALAGPIAKSVDLTEVIDVPLPTDRLMQAGERRTEAF